MANVVILDLPANTTIMITGLTNAQGWSEQIIVVPAGGPALTWTGTGAQSNQVVGQYTMAPSAGPTQVKVQMQFDPGSGYQPSEVQSVPFSFPQGGLSGYVVGGQDGGGRGSGPAFWNTLVFIYYATGY